METSQGFFSNAGEQSRVTADHRYVNYVKTALGGCGQPAKANCQRWQAYQGPDADPQLAEQLSANPSRKKQM